MTNIRKHFTLTKNEADTLKGAAKAAGVPVGAYVRALIEGFLEVGSDRQVEKTVEIPVLIDPDIVADAERKARLRYQCSLRDILRFEIKELDKL